MGVVRQTNTFLALALACSALACGDRPAPAKGGVTAADVIAGTAQSLDHFESTEGKFAIDFPAVWKDHYVAVPHADTTAGAHYIVDFGFKPDPAWKVPPRTLLVIRVFTPAAWAKVADVKGQQVGVRLKERGNDVYVLSLAGSNPYKTGTPASLLYDQMMLAVIHDSAPLRLTPR
jgi:hypothetical protein